jgi:hypothetical protein
VPNEPASHSIGADPTRILKCSLPLFRGQRPNNVTPRAFRILTVTTRMPGPTGTPDYRRGLHEIQAALLYDYCTNVASYPAWRTWLRAHGPPTLVV